MGFLATAVWEFKNTVKPLLGGHLRDLPKCPLNRECPPNRAQCLFKNIQRSLCPVIKFHEMLYFGQDC